MMKVDEINAWFYSTWGQRVGLGLLILLSILVLLSVTHGIKTIHQDTILVSKPLPKPSHQMADLISSIPDQHIFGKYGAFEAVPITSLQLHLVGIIKATPVTQSKIIISEQGQPAKIYQIGDTLSSSGVKVHDITEEGVVLENGGRLEKLPLTRPVLQFEGIPRSLPK